MSVILLQLLPVLLAGVHSDLQCYTDGYHIQLCLYSSREWHDTVLLPPACCPLRGDAILHLISAFGQPAFDWFSLSRCSQYEPSCCCCRRCCCCCCCSMTCSFVPGRHLFPLMMIILRSLFHRDVTAAAVLYVRVRV